MVHANIGTCIFLLMGTAEDLLSKIRIWSQKKTGIITNDAFLTVLTLE